MTLKNLLKNIDIIKTNADMTQEITGVVSDSRNVIKGNVFVAIVGEGRDGNEYIKEAIEKGACLIISSSREKCSEEIPFVLVNNTREVLAKICSSFYQNPSKDIKIIAITGTNGKTSTSYFLYNILREANKKVGLISTVEILADDEKIETNGGSSVVDKVSAMTTPDPEILYKILYIMKEKEIEYVVMEASSHALSQNKLEGLEIEIGIFTNLSTEHLDYHKTMQEYFSAKEKLFQNSKLCVINTDNEYGKMIKKMNCGRSFTVSTERGADFEIINSNVTSSGIEYEMICESERLKLKSNICGYFNILNSSLAVACAKILQISNEEIIRGIFTLENIKGRFERYKNKNIYIDYAHTPEAVEGVIKSAKSIFRQGRIIVLLGCGGNRDKSKREKIGKISTILADLTIVTSDNPRNEHPIDIIKDIISGIENEKWVMIPDRKEAIKYAVNILEKNDTLLLLGKGHETYEINKSGKHPFDERKILDEVYSIG